MALCIVAEDQPLSHLNGTSILLFTREQTPSFDSSYSNFSSLNLKSLRDIYNVHDEQQHRGQLAD